MVGDTGNNVTNLDTASGVVRFGALTNRERQVATLVCSGFANKMIAHELAHAYLRHAGRHPDEDPEFAADSLAAAWGFPRP